MAKLSDILGGLAGVRPDGWDGINPGGWEYPRLPTVDRILPPKDAQMFSELLPRLFVVPARGSVVKGQNQRQTIYRHRLMVDIHGVIEATENPPVLMDTWRWYLRHDIITTLLRNMTLGGLAERLDFEERPEQVDAGEVGPTKGWFLQPITVWLNPIEYQAAA